MIEATPVLSTVLVEPDADLLTLVWRGTIPAIRPYMAQELERMPFEVIW